MTENVNKDKPTAVDKLHAMLGYDPSKHGSADKDMLAEVLKEIQSERSTAIKAKAKEQLQKAIDLRGQMEKLKREFNTQYSKFEKELGKILSQIGNAQQQADNPDATEETAETAEATK